MSTLNHKNEFAEAHFKKLMEGQFNDIKIICSDGVVEANKLMLSLRSDYFKAMFESSNFIEAKTGEARMAGCKKSLMDADEEGV